VAHEVVVQIAAGRRARAQIGFGRFVLGVEQDIANLHRKGFGKGGVIAPLTDDRVVDATDLHRRSGNHRVGRKPGPVRIRGHLEPVRDLDLIEAEGRQGIADLVGSQPVQRLDTGRRQIRLGALLIDGQQGEDVRLLLARKARDLHLEPHRERVAGGQHQGDQHQPCAGSRAHNQGPGCIDRLHRSTSSRLIQTCPLDHRQKQSDTTSEPRRIDTANAAGLFVDELQQQASQKRQFVS